MTGHTASELGEIVVEDQGYGLGEPDGMLVLRYPTGRAVPDFPEYRDDLVHQLFHSPNGALSVRRGGATHFAAADQCIWVRKGVVAEVSGFDVQTVIRVCIRRAPDELTAHSAAVLDVDAELGGLLEKVSRPGLSSAAGLEARQQILSRLAANADRRGTLTHATAPKGPAREVARAILHDPADNTDLATWADRMHVSTKTLQRSFQGSFGASFSDWRTRTRLHASLALLPHASVTETAHRVGYGSPSAYIAAFSKEFGSSPKRFLANRGG
ncbi:helix-turn-helix transcriptional regulator [Nocardioides sp. Bht2]|uniref:helix-turn-helix transcriptional regulator n=1 Tax=Nocardioides sp. Bht2 TaxID=3392297 RepID=UPI0039B5CE0A